MDNVGTLIRLAIIALCFSTGQLYATNLCNTQECDKTASDILNKMDESTDPCEDFFTYSCGNFMKKEIPADRQRIGGFYDILNITTNQILSVIEGDTSASPEIAKRLIKTFYTTCTSSDHETHRSKRPLLDDFEKAGGFPALNPNWNENNFHLVDTLANITAIGLAVESLVGVAIGMDFKNTSNYIITVKEPSLGIGRNYLLDHLKNDNNSKVQSYLDYMVDVMELLGADCDTVENDMRDVLDFTMSLANITQPLDEARDVIKQYNKMTVRDLQMLGDAIDWNSLFNKLIDHAEITDDEYVIVHNPSYIRSVNLLIKRTSKRTIANYLLWGVTMSSVHMMDESFQKLRDAFVKVYSGQKEREPISRSCIGQISGRLGAALSAMYATEYIPNTTKTVLSEIGKNIGIEFQEILENAIWLDKSTKERALEKLKSFRQLFVHPDELLDEAILTKYLIQIKLEDTHYENIRNLRAIDLRDAYSKFGTKLDKYHWTTFRSIAHKVNAAFYPTRNMIVFYGGILQYPLFNIESSKFLNYGGAGFIFGHEVTHGFDDNGRRFDKDGNMNSWWTNSTDQKYKDLSKCMIEQYGNYSHLGHRLNGKQTIGENIADNGGLKQAYSAYTKLMDSDITLEKLKKFTKKQLFWISFAQVFCIKATKEATENQINHGQHTIGKYRVIGPVSNQAEFAKDFNCAASAAMNPSKKCVVW